MGRGLPSVLLTAELYSENVMMMMMMMMMMFLVAISCLD
jgi:hypothetical protein